MGIDDVGGPEGVANTDGVIGEESGAAGTEDGGREAGGGVGATGE